MGKNSIDNMQSTSTEREIVVKQIKRIHQDDAAGFIAFLVNKITLSQSVNKCYIVTDSAPVSQYEVLKWLAAQMHITQPNSVISPPTAGKRLSNQQMLATGYHMQYPDYQAGYTAVLKLFNKAL